MSTRLDQRRARLRAEYGFDFPDDFYRFWDFVNRLSPLDPLHALTDTLGVVLVGPFEILAGRFDGRVPRRSLLLHWRYYDDPPEFFTVLACEDGMHWGWYLDDPTNGSGCVAAYSTQDSFEVIAIGDTLFEAMRLLLEDFQVDYQVMDPRNPLYDEATELWQRIESLRPRLMEFGAGDRPETGEEYILLYDEVTRRKQRVIAKTMKGIGIVVPPSSYRPLLRANKQLWRHLRQTDDPADVVEEARQALRDGFPGTALKLGADLWATTGPTKTAYAYELLDAAYADLGREVLRNVLQTHRANRDLPSVDILQEEDDASE